MKIIYIAVAKQKVVYVGSSLRVAKDKARQKLAPHIFKVEISFVDFEPSYHLASVFVASQTTGHYCEYSPEVYHRWFHGIKL